MHLIQSSNMGTTHAQRDHFVLIFNNKHIQTHTHPYTLSHSLMLLFVYVHSRTEEHKWEISKTCKATKKEKSKFNKNEK